MRNTIAGRSAVAASLLASVLLLSGCDGADNTSAADTSGSNTSAATSGPTINVTITGDKVTPQGQRIQVKVGQAVTLNVTSDRAGELHVHSTPERELAHDKGTTKLKVTINKPGIV